jgi:hypothetical protein
MEQQSDPLSGGWFVTPVEFRDVCEGHGVAVVAYEVPEFRKIKAGCHGFGLSCQGFYRFMICTFEASLQ